MFTKKFNEIATDNELQALQSELIAYPESGDLITGQVAFVSFGLRLKTEVKVVLELSVS